MSDDRFTEDSTVFKKPEDGEAGWEGITVEQYFRKAFAAGKESHRYVQAMRKFYPKTYDRIKAESFKPGIVPNMKE